MSGVAPCKVYEGFPVSGRVPNLVSRYLHPAITSPTTPSSFPSLVFPLPHGPYSLTHSQLWASALAPPSPLYF